VPSWLLASTHAGHSQEGPNLGAMFARMLIVMMKAIDVLVPTLTVSNATSEGTKSSLGPSLYFSEIHLGNAVLSHQFGGGGSGTARCRGIGMFDDVRVRVRSLSRSRFFLPKSSLVGQWDMSRN
jgi:hypothetical protein